MALNELIEFLESIADPGLQESYDNSGLIFGNPDSVITGVLCSLDCTIDVLKEAKALSCNVVVSHHPIVFNGIKKINLNSYVDKALVFAIKNDIAIYAIHTNLDNVLEKGVNQKIASKLLLKNLEILKKKSTFEQIGAGITGDLEKEMTEVEFLSYVKTKMNTKLIRHTKLTDNKIKKIAIAGGSGSFLIKDAINSGADVFVTSDIKYHDFFDANDEILLLDIGHFESEQFTTDLLYELISEKFSNFATHYSKTCTNPVHYF
jgi:dinuclear metal center YbgI/SA1388 family protein